MARIISIVLIFFMLAPIFTPVAEAFAQCGDECAVGQGHECKHGKTCPMHKKKGAGHGAHEGDAAHPGHSGHDSHQGHAADQGHSGLQAHHDEGVKTDGKALICTVSDIGEEENAGVKQRACFLMSGCGHDKDPLSTVLGSDYLISKSHFEPVKKTGFIKSAKHQHYQGHVPDLFERPPST